MNTKEFIDIENIKKDLVKFGKYAKILVELVENASTARTLYEKMVNKKVTRSHLVFWRQTQRNSFNEAILLWCKIFGSEKEDTHWKKFIKNNKFEIDLLESLEITQSEWDNYISHIKCYRDQFHAHSDDNSKKNMTYPILIIALKSAFFCYNQLRLSYNIGVDYNLLNDDVEDLEIYYSYFRREQYNFIKVAYEETNNLN